MDNPYWQKNIQPVYPPCEECLKRLDMGGGGGGGAGGGVREWEDHINIDHLGKNFGGISLLHNSLPFVSIVRDEVHGNAFSTMMPTDTKEIIQQMKDEIPAKYHYFLEIGVKLAIARTKQEMELLLEKSK